MRPETDKDELETFRQVNAVYPVSRETFERFDDFRGLLESWQKKTNLVAPETLPQFWSRHVCDSLQCLSFFPDAECWVDLGSGAGFPGLIIAAANRDHKNRQHHLVESNNKKCAFLRAAARALGANAKIHGNRIESVTEQLVSDNERVDVVTARALAPLRKLLDLSSGLLMQGAVGLFHKGRDFQREIEDCHGFWRFDLVIHNSCIEADSVLLEIRNPVRQPS
ncbi:MAG: 16S rRNA (guanine(527)-N(7))-methyltransferase RsmG [Pseudomonadota bacterium]